MRRRRGTTGTTSKSTWTILVYMNAANNLYQESPINIEANAGKPPQTGT